MVHLLFAYRKKTNRLLGTFTRHLSIILPPHKFAESTAHFYIAIPTKPLKVRISHKLSQFHFPVESETFSVCCIPFVRNENLFQFTCECTILACFHEQSGLHGANSLTTKTTSIQPLYDLVINFFINIVFQCKNVLSKMIDSYSVCGRRFFFNAFK